MFSTSATLAPLNFTSSVSRLNRRSSQTGQGTQMSARKSISSFVAPCPWQCSHRPPGTLNENRPGLKPRSALCGSFVYRSRI